MTKIIYCTFLALAVSSYVCAQKGASRPGAAREEVSFCSLVNEPIKFDGQSIIVKATFRYSFEHSELYCLCSGKKIWVEFEDSFKQHSKKRALKNIKDNGPLGRTLNVLFEGKFYAVGGYGHFGIYPFKLVVTSVQMTDIVADIGADPQALSKSQQEKLCH